MVYDCDVRHSLHKSGDWYLIPKKYAFWYQDRNYSSVLFHVCSKPWYINGSLISDLPYTVHRLHKNNLDGPCLNCGRPAPDDIQALWLLHNWDVLT